MALGENQKETTDAYREGLDKIARDEEVECDRDQWNAIIKAQHIKKTGAFWKVNGKMSFREGSTVYRSPW